MMAGSAKVEPLSRLLLEGDEGNLAADSLVGEQLKSSFL